MAALLLALCQFTQVGQRFQDPLVWKDEIRRCEQADSFQMPIHFNGCAILFGMWN